MIRIITNSKYVEMWETIRRYGKEISSLKEDYDDLWISYSQVFKCKDDEIARLNKEINDLKDELENKKIAFDTLYEALGDKENKLEDKIEEVEKLKAENKSLKAAKGGYVVQMNKLKKDLEETQKKLEESMTDKYLVKRVPMGKLPKSQVMKMKSHAKQDKIIQKIYEKMEKDEI